MRPRRKRRGIWRRGAGACRSNAEMRAASKSKAKDAPGGRDKLGTSFYESLLFTRLRKFQRHLGAVRAGHTFGAFFKSKFRPHSLGPAGLACGFALTGFTAVAAGRCA